MIDNNIKKDKQSIGAKLLIKEVHMQKRQWEGRKDKILYTIVIQKASKEHIPYNPYTTFNRLEFYKANKGEWVTEGRTNKFIEELHS